MYEYCKRIVGYLISFIDECVGSGILGINSGLGIQS